MIYNDVATSKSSQKAGIDRRKDHSKLRKADMETDWTLKGEPTADGRLGVNTEAFAW